MKKSMIASLLLAVSGAGAEAPAAPAPASTAVPPLRARLTEDLIRAAVRDMRAQDRAETEAKAEADPAGRVLSGGGYRRFARALAESKRPSCFGDDALKFQPSEHDTKNWHFGATGPMATPFWIAAVVRGKCR
jgi:hypothetical protein